MDFINNLPENIKNLQVSISESLKKQFDKELESQARSLTDIIKKIWEDMMPGVLKRAIGSTYTAFWEFLGKGAAGAGEIIKAAGSLGEIMVDYTSNVIKPMKDAFGKEDTWVDKIIGVVSKIPDSMVAAWDNVGETMKKVGSVFNRV